MAPKSALPDTLQDQLKQSSDVIIVKGLREYFGPGSGCLGPAVNAQQLEPNQ